MTAPPQRLRLILALVLSTATWLGTLPWQYKGDAADLEGRERLMSSFLAPRASRVTITQGAHPWYPVRSSLLLPSCPAAQQLSCTQTSPLAEDIPSCPLPPSTKSPSKWNPRRQRGPPRLRRVEERCGWTAGSAPGFSRVTSGAWGQARRDRPKLSALPSTAGGSP